MNISLILATVGRTKEISCCLRSLMHQTDRHFEVLLIDQNSDDRLVPYIQSSTEDGLAITHHRLLKPNLSKARNLGIKHALGDVIGLTDDDCWYEHDTIEYIRKAFLSNPLLDGVVAHWVEQSEARRCSPLSGYLSLQEWCRFRGGDASSITLFLKRDLFIRLGGFDERFGLGQWFGAGEETDFVLRILMAGGKLAHCPEARVHHRFSPKPEGAWILACRNVRMRSRGTGGIYAKHRLSMLVVIRGLIAPVLVPLIHGNLPAAIKGLFISIGRFEGFLRWKFKEST